MDESSCQAGWDTAREVARLLDWINYQAALLAPEVAEHFGWAADGRHLFRTLDLCLHVETGLMILRARGTGLSLSP